MMTFLRSRSGNVVTVGRPQLGCCQVKNQHCADRKWRRHHCSTWWLSSCSQNTATFRYMFVSVRWMS